LYFNFDPYSFNYYFSVLNPFVQLNFFLKKFILQYLINIWRDNLSWLNPYYCGYMFVMPTRVDSSYFFLGFFNPISSFLYLMRYELNYIVCLFLKKSSFSSDLEFSFNFIDRYCLFFYHLIKIKLIYLI
jgi:hypothetical protein